MHAVDAFATIYIQFAVLTSRALAHHFQVLTLFILFHKAQPGINVEPYI